MMFYRTNCTVTEAKLLEPMCENAEEISLIEFKKEVDSESFNEFSKMLGYNKNFPIEKEPFITYHKSNFDGKPCVYAVQSAIEWIFY